MRIQFDKARLSRPLFAVCLGATLLALPAASWSQTSDTQTDLDDVQAEFGEAFETIGAYSAEQRDKAIEATRSTLANIDEQIDGLEARIRDRWADMSDATRDRTAEALSALRERRNRMSEALGALSQGGGSAWDDLMAGVRSGWNDLESAWDDAVAAMGTETEEGE